MFRILISNWKYWQKKFVWLQRANDFTSDDGFVENRAKRGHTGETLRV